MARAIDGGTLRDNLTDIYGDGNRLVYLNDVLDLIDEQPTRTPPNDLLTLEELNLKPGEYAVCLAKRNPFSGWYPMVIRRERNGYVNPVCEQYVTEILGGFRIPDLMKAEEDR